MRLLSFARTTAAALTLACSHAAFADPCPGDTSVPPKECESVVVYRVQTWPALLTDANLVRMDSLSEANAADLIAFRDVLKAYGKSEPGTPSNLKLALRFKVWRLVGEPKDYCNCNFEVAVNGKTKACKPPIAKQDLVRCVRTCWHGSDQCRASGFNATSNSGRWYAFPASTEYRLGKTWAKNTFAVSAANADWSADPPVIKRAECLGRLLAQDSSLDIDSLFTEALPCPAVLPAQLAQEAIPRN